MESRGRGEEMQREGGLAEEGGLGDGGIRDQDRRGQTGQGGMRREKVETGDGTKE